MSAFASRFAFTLGLGLNLSLCAGAASRAEDISFQKEVWPIFKRHCAGCHGAQKSKGKLRLDDVQSLLKGGKTGPLFMPGHPEDSLLIDQITGDEPEMPQKEAPLSRAKVALLREWVAQGAKIDGPPKSNVPPVEIPETYTVAPAVSSVTISPDGKIAAAACRSEVALLSVEGDSAPRRIPTEFDQITHVEISPDGKVLAVAGGSPQQFGGVLFFEVETAKLLSQRRIGSDTLFKGMFSPNGQILALGGPNGAVYLIPVDEKAPVKSVELHSDWVTAVAFTADGKELVSGSRDKTTKISSAENLTLLRSVDQSPEMINAVAADPADAISGGNARALMGYDFKLALAGVEVGGSGNGARPVSNRGQYLRAFEGQADAIMALATSGDRKLLAVATRAAEIRVYATENRQRKMSIANAPAPVLTVALNGDGSRLILGSKTGEVQIWDTTANKLVRALTPVPVKEGNK